MGWKSEMMQAVGLLGLGIVSISYKPAWRLFSWLMVPIFLFYLGFGVYKIRSAWRWKREEILDGIRRTHIEKYHNAKNPKERGELHKTFVAEMKKRGVQR